MPKPKQLKQMEADFRKRCNSCKVAQAKMNATQVPEEKTRLQNLINSDMEALCNYPDRLLTKAFTEFGLKGLRDQLNLMYFKTHELYLDK